MSSRLRIEKESPILDSIVSNVRMAAVSLLERERSKLDALECLTEVLNPSATLKRGYSITRIDGKAVTCLTSAKPGAILETQIAEGSIISTVSETSQP